MPRYEITAPTGERYEITAPEGASEAEIMSYAQSQFQAQTEKPQETGFIDEIQNAITRRSAEADAAKSQPMGRRQLRQAATGARFVGDVASASTPDIVKQGLAGMLNLGAQGVRALPMGNAMLNLGETVPQDLRNAGVPEDVMKDLQDAATVGAFVAPLPKVGGLAMNVGENIKDVGKKMVSVTKLSADDLAKQAGAVYKRAKQVGGTIKPNVVDDFIDNARKTVTPQTAAGKIVAGSDDVVTKIMDRLEGLRGKTIDLDEFQEVDELLGDYIDSYVKPTGGLDKTGKKILQIQDELRGRIENASPLDIVGSKEGFEALKEGRSLWSRQAKLRDIEKIILRAESMDNPSTGIRTGFRTLASNPKRMRGYSAAEKEAIKNAAKSGKVEFVRDIIRPVTSRLSPVIGMGTGNVGAATLLNLGGMAAREGVDALKLGQAERIAQMIARGGNAYRPPVSAYVANTGLGSLGNVLGLTGRVIKDFEATRAPQAGLVNLLNQEESPIFKNRMLGGQYVGD